MTLSQPGSPVEPRINGVMLLNRLDNLGMLRGKPVQEAVFADLPPDLHQALAQRRIASGRWYPISWLRALHTSIQRVTGAGPELARQLGYFGSKSTVAEVRRALSGRTGLSDVLGHAATIFHVYYEKGAMKVDRVDSHMAIASWSECDGFDRNLWEVTFGSCEALLEIAGARHVHLEVSSGGGDGDAHARITTLWQ